MASTKAQQPTDMEVDGEIEPEICSLSGGGCGGVGGGGCYTRDTKRLKRGPTPPCPAPSLPAEDAFVSGVLASCLSPEQRRFAAAYRKWLDSVIGQ